MIKKPEDKKETSPTKTEVVKKSKATEKVSTFKKKKKSQQRYNFRSSICLFNF